MMRVLNLGSGVLGTGGDWAEDTEEVRVDGDPAVEPDVVADVRALPPSLGKFDVVLASHILEHLGKSEVLPALEDWASFLVEGGMLHVFVPDVAWAAEQIVAGRMGWGVQAHLYGSQAGRWQGHKVGFTMGMLRAAVSAAGLVVRDARAGPYEIKFSGDDGEELVVVARQLYVVGQKPKIN